jgi:hypothetical protein
MKLFVSIVSTLFLSAIAIGEAIVWPAVQDATFYRVSYGAVGGPTNVVNASTNLVTWTNKITGVPFQSPGIDLGNLPLNVRHFIYVQTVQSNATTLVLSSPSVSIFYTPRTSPAPVVLGD